MITDNLAWLQNWCADQCNGDWEHIYGVEIDTHDSPGWLVSIDLAKTQLENKEFDTVIVGVDGSDQGVEPRWHRCHKVTNKFEASCGVHDLSTVLTIFRDCAEADKQS